MSAPTMNSVMSTQGTASSAASIPLPPMKAPVPPAAKAQVNHTPATPPAASVGQENNTKSPDKPKEISPKPTANGVEEPSVNNSIVADVPEPSNPTPPPPPPAAIPTPVPAPVPVSASVPLPAPTVAAAAPVVIPAAAAVAASVPVAAATVPLQPSIEPPVEPPSEKDAVPLPLPEPEPDEAASPLEPSKPLPKVPKAQAAKRRREPRAPAAPTPTEDGTPEKKPRRTRAPVSPYQCPLPEMATVLSRSLKIKDNSQKPNDERLIVFYKNEFLAVRNAEGGFYLCQTMQNIYRSSHKIHIRWLSCDDKDGTNDGGIYTRDFYDKTDFECILTTVELKKLDRDQYKMPPAELERVESILRRALDVEKGSEKPAVTEEHPDGLDLSLYTDESQLQKTKSTKRRHSPVRKASSPKRAKKPKKALKKSPSVVANNYATSLPSTSSKTRATTRKPPANRNPPPPPVEKSRAERISARDKAVASTSKTTIDKIKTEKSVKSKAKPKAAKGKKKTPVKPAEIKTDKKADMKKSKTTTIASPVASTSKKVVAADKRKSNAHRPVRKRK